MPRETNVPYHQNVYDLLDLEPGVCPIASRMIADHEAEYGPLPASVREWYSVPKMVPLASDESDGHEGTLWFDYSNADGSVPLPDVLTKFSRLSGRLLHDDNDPSDRNVAVMIENQGVVTWEIDIEGDEDPPVLSDWHDPEGPTLWSPRGIPFSQFVWVWLSRYHREDFTPLSLRHIPDIHRRERPPGRKPNESTHWLCTPATPYPVPLIDYLIDHLGDPAIRPVPLCKRPQSRQYATDLFGDPVPYQSPTGVSQFTFTCADGLIRLTTDNLDHPNPHVAWWIAGHTREAFERLRELLRPWNCFGPVVRTSGDASA